MVKLAKGCRVLDEGAYRCRATKGNNLGYTSQALLSPGRQNKCTCEDTSVWQLYHILVTLVEETI